MAKLKDILKPVGELNITRVFINKKNGQMTITLPKKKMKSVPTKIRLTYW
jgi:hypothetical protein